MAIPLDSKIKPDFEVFENWAIKHLPLEKLETNEDIAQLKSQFFTDCLVEFSSIEERDEFIKEYDAQWINPLAPLEDTSDSQRESNSPKESSQNSKYFEFIAAFRHSFYLWVNATFEWIETISSDDRIVSIYGNRSFYLCLNDINQIFQVDKIKGSFLGFSGNNVTVGLIDTGIDTSHPDLVDSVIDRINVTTEDANDNNGHGTFLASIIAGTGKASSNLYHGIAPNAKLFDIKIFNQKGQATTGDALVALDLILDRKAASRPNIIVFGGITSPSEIQQNPITEYCEKIIQENILIIAPSGNFGPDLGSIGSPASDAPILTVGAIELDETPAFFSGRGDVELASIKPDLVIPGVKIIAAKSLNSFIGEICPDNPNYSVLSGTSISGAIMGGLAALYLDAFPEATPSEIKENFIKWSKQISGSLQTFGHGSPNLISILKSAEKLLPRPYSYKKAQCDGIILALCGMALITGIYFLFQYWLH